MKITDEDNEFTKVYAWGFDTCGQLGVSKQAPGKCYKRPKFCTFSTIIKQIACGDEHSVIVTGIFFII